MNMSQKLLITGASGLVGGNAAVLGAKTWNVTATYESHPFEIAGVHTVRLDLENFRDVRSLVLSLRPQAVIHCAAWSRLDECESDRSRTFKINSESVRVLAEACAESGSRLVFTSTDMVFDGEKGNYAETDPVHPVSVYGESKCAAEEHIRRVCADHAIARVALVYGKPVTGGTSFSEGLLKAWKDGKSTPLFTDQFRTPVEAAGLAEALLELASSLFRGTMHAGGADRADRHAFGRFLAQKAGVPDDLLLPVSMFDAALPARRPRDASFDTSLARSVLKTRLLGFREGIEKAYPRAGV
jgi:dTDP-4-dehydrorhamnose reductase